MFTPPPSPNPAAVQSDIQEQDEKQAQEQRQLEPEEAKRRIGRRTKWTVVIVPIVLIFITLSTRYVTHPAAFDLFANDPVPPITNWHPADLLTPHKRHPQAAPTPTPAGAASASASGSAGASTKPTSTSASASSSSVAGTAQPIPTVPTNPTLPTPFPQPWDSTFGQNFSSTSCFNFFNNMTNTLPFRACRPFSLLLQSSRALIEAQENLTALNAIIAGTCSTTLSLDQCTANMKWFASELKSACTADLEDRNANAVDALIGIQAYPLLRAAGCQIEPTSNTYCYLNAVHNSNPSDLYVYQLPLGLNFPAVATPTCSSCTKSLLALYLPAVENGVNDASLLGTEAVDTLKDTYQDAEVASDKTCGEGYVQGSLAANSSNSSWRRRPRLGLGMFAAALMGVVSMW